MLSALENSNRKQTHNVPFAFEKENIKVPAWALSGCF
jgi:hypothetical protein